MLVYIFLILGEYESIIPSLEANTSAIKSFNHTYPSTSSPITPSSIEKAHAGVASPYQEAITSQPTQIQDDAEDPSITFRPPLGNVLSTTNVLTSESTEPTSSQAKPAATTFRELESQTSITKPQTTPLREVQQVSNQPVSRNPSPVVEAIEIIYTHQPSRRVRQWVRDPPGPVRPPKSSHPQSVPDSTPKREESAKGRAWLEALVASPPRQSASPTSLQQPSQPRDEQAREFATAWIIGDGLQKRPYTSSACSSSSVYISPPRQSQNLQHFPELNSVRKAMEAASAKFGSVSSPCSFISPPRSSVSPSTARVRGIMMHRNGSHSSSYDELPDDGVVTPLPAPVYFAPVQQPSPSQQSAVKLYDHRLLPRESAQWATPQPVHVVFDRTP
ncbi:Hypothetical protein, putative [Bodo saltans]|uniref:Uncharacterized protein n=1 Tax=Bodo saltans TaxID=75058 RepID=A0A0S4JSP6_BODSA|nr:Hypothetical protein, putative [Bodo saltans]|eukprot:CUG93844.1 Hypothetical protein, putative [Bodo saltans]